MSSLTVELKSILAFLNFLLMFMMGLSAIKYDIMCWFYINMFVMFFIFYRLIHFYFKTKELEEKDGN